MLSVMARPFAKSHGTDWTHQYQTRQAYVLFLALVFSINELVQQY